MQFPNIIKQAMRRNDELDALAAAGSSLAVTNRRWKVEMWSFFRSLNSIYTHLRAEYPAHVTLYYLDDFRNFVTFQQPALAISIRTATSLSSTTVRQQNSTHATREVRMANNNSIDHSSSTHHHNNMNNMNNNNGKQPCRYFQRGHCDKGANCPFAHIRDKHTPPHMRGAPSAAVPNPRSSGGAVGLPCTVQQFNSRGMPMASVICSLCDAIVKGNSATSWENSFKIHAEKKHGHAASPPSARAPRTHRGTTAPPPSYSSPPSPSSASDYGEEEEKKEEPTVGNNEWECLLCWETREDGRYKVALQVCGHVCCSECEPKFPTCPICRQVKTGVLRLYD